MAKPVSAASGQYQNIALYNNGMQAAQVLLMTAILSTVTYYAMKEAQKHTKKWKIQPFQEGHVPANLAWASLAMAYTSFGIAQTKLPNHYNFIKFIQQIQGQVFEKTDPALINNNREYNTRPKIVGQLNDQRYNGRITLVDSPIAANTGSTLLDLLMGGAHNLSEKQAVRVMNQLEYQVFGDPSIDVYQLFFKIYPDGALAEDQAKDTEMKLSFTDTHCIVEGKRDYVFRNGLTEIFTVEINVKHEIPKAEGGVETASYSWKINEIRNLPT